MRAARRWDSFGETIFSEITALAIEHGALNLGQGFPSFDGPDFIKEAATRAMGEGKNQYPRSAGVIELVERIAASFERTSGLIVDPLTEVTVTSGCTEALTAAGLGLFDPGDEVILIEPFYDSYPAVLAMAGAVPRSLVLHPPHFRIEAEALEEVVGPRTRAILVNTPHNPTGRVFDERELEAVAAVCQSHDLIALADEVYEHMVFDGATHRSLATLDGMWERTLTLSSLGKTFALTGWKVGWAIGPPPLTAAVRSAHQFITFTTASPLQWGAVAALDAPGEYYETLRREYAERRAVLGSGLEAAGFEVIWPEGTYFMLADHTPFGQPDDVTFVRWLIEHAGVAAIPPSAFFSDPASGRDLVRFAFCKDLSLLEEAVERLGALDA